MPRLKDLYSEHIVQTLLKDLGYQNVMQVPRLQKIVVNVGMGEALQNAKALDAAVEDITTHHRAKAHYDSGAQVDRQFQVARGESRWREGDPAR